MSVPAQANKKQARSMSSHGLLSLHMQERDEEASRWAG
jgi:hypothetical protein